MYRLPILLAFVLLPVLSLAGIRAEVSAELGDDGIASVRAKVLDAALTESVRTMVARHLPREERVTGKSDLSPLYRNASKFVTRYKIESEGPSSGRYRLAVVAEVNGKLLLKKLEELGFMPRAMKARPRVLVTSSDPGSQKLMGLISEKFTGEAFPTTSMALPGVGVAASTSLADGLKSDLPKLGGESAEGWKVSREMPLWKLRALSPEAVALGRHVVCGVILIDDGSNDEASWQELTPEAGYYGFLPPGFELGEGGEPFLRGIPREVERRMVAAGFIADSLDGSLLGEHMAEVVGRGADGASAEGEAMKKLAEELFQKFYAALNLSSWRLVGEAVDLEVRVEGVTSPALVAPLGDGLRALTELEALDLGSVGPSTIAWSAKGVDPGFGWEAIAAATDLGQLSIEWRFEPTVMSEAAEAPQLNDGGQMKEEPRHVGALVGRILPSP